MSTRTGPTTAGPLRAYVASRTETSSTRKSSVDLLCSVQPTSARQFSAFASFSPAPENSVMSSSDTPRNIRNNRVKMQFSAVTEMSTAAAIFAGVKNRYAMFLCWLNALILFLESEATLAGVVGKSQKSVLDEFRGGA